MTTITQGSFELDPTGSTITIGEGHSSKNNLKITITNNGAAQATVRVTVRVKCGDTEEALLGAATDKVSSSDNLSALTTSPANSRSWQSLSKGVAVDASKQLSISLSGFDSNTPPGDAHIALLVQTFKDNVWSPQLKQNDVWSLVSECLTVKKDAEKPTEPKIHYFSVTPDYILHAGQTPVAVSFYATGFERFTLYRNNQEVQNWPSNEHPKNPDGSITGEFLDQPSITTVYRLRGVYKVKEKEIEEVRYRNIQVISPGWNQIALPQGYPARLFVAQDFSGSGVERLYGIFIDGTGHAALYSSATGVDDWRPEDGDVPQQMATSPGVAYDNKLWLIGGSCVDPEKVGNEVWCYQRDEDSGKWLNKLDPSAKDPDWSFPNEMGNRMGHVCVVFQQELWVLGGYNQTNSCCYNDVWRLKKEDASAAKYKWEFVNKNCFPNGRLNPAAVTFNNLEGKNEVWIYGGSEKPQSGGLSDLWSTTNGEVWSNRPSNEFDYKIMPDPGTPLGATLVAFPPSVSAETQTSDRLFLIGSFLEGDDSGTEKKTGSRVSSFLFEWLARKGFWEARPVFNGWQQFRGSNFYMHAVAFNGFLFLWSLQQVIDSTPKLNILIPQ